MFFFPYTSYIYLSFKKDYIIFAYSTNCTIRINDAIHNLTCSFVHNNASRYDCRGTHKVALLPSHARRGEVLPLSRIGLPHPP